MVEAIPELAGCPGCGARTEQIVCCNRCWMRAPQDLGPHQRWRDKVRAARGDGDWYSDDTVRDIHAELIYWLRMHPTTFGRQT